MAFICNSFLLCTALVHLFGKGHAGRRIDAQPGTVSDTKPLPGKPKAAAVNRFLNTIVSWLRAGYPEGVPTTDYQPLFALLSNQLSHDEVKSVTRELLRRSELDDADIGAEIIRLTDGLPSPADIERVRHRLAARGWPLDDPRDQTDAQDQT